MVFSNLDKDDVIRRYTDKFNQFGYSPKSLGWDKGKQEIRFDVLTSLWDYNDASILDIGCGFADLYKFASEKFQIKNYTGIELVPALANKAKEIYKDEPKVKILESNFLEMAESELAESYDYVLISGMFNFKLQENKDNYKFIEEVLKKAYKLVNQGISADFMSSKVDFEYEHSFYSDPAKIIDIAYSMSRNVVLRNDYFPFEFAAFISKHEAFDKEDTIFKSFKAQVGES